MVVLFFCFHTLSVHCKQFTSYLLGNYEDWNNDRGGSYTNFFTTLIIIGSALEQPSITSQKSNADGSNW
jgi:hypothetical protein